MFPDNNENLNPEKQHTEPGLPPGIFRNQKITKELHLDHQITKEKDEVSIIGATLPPGGK